MVIIPAERPLYLQVQVVQALHASDQESSGHFPIVKIVARMTEQFYLNVIELWRFIQERLDFSKRSRPGKRPLNLIFFYRL